MREIQSRHLSICELVPISQEALTSSSRLPNALDYLILNRTWTILDAATVSVFIICTFRFYSHPKCFICLTDESGCDSLAVRMVTMCLSTFAWVSPHLLGHCWLSLKTSVMGNHCSSPGNKSLLICHKDRITQRVTTTCSSALYEEFRCKIILYNK